MTVLIDFSQALSEDPDHAQAGLKTRPFDPVYHSTLDQIAVIDAASSRDGDLRRLRPGDITLGRMAAKELGTTRPRSLTRCISFSGGSTA